MTKRQHGNKELKKPKKPAPKSPPPQARDAPLPSGNVPPRQKDRK